MRYCHALAPAIHAYSRVTPVATDLWLRCFTRPETCAVWMEWALHAQLIQNFGVARRMMAKFPEPMILPAGTQLLRNP